MLWHSATVREGRQDLVYNSCGIYEVGVFSSFVLFGWALGGRWNVTSIRRSDKP